MMTKPITVEVRIFFAVFILSGLPAAVKKITPPIIIIKTAKGKRISFAKKSTILLNKTKRWQRVQGQHSHSLVQGSLQPLPQGTSPPLSSFGHSPKGPVPKGQGHASGQGQVQFSSQGMQEGWFGTQLVLPASQSPPEHPGGPQV